MVIAPMVFAVESVTKSAGRWAAEGAPSKTRMPSFVMIISPERKVRSSRMETRSGLIGDCARTSFAVWSRTTRGRDRADSAAGRTNCGPRGAACAAPLTVEGCCGGDGVSIPPPKRADRKPGTPSSVEACGADVTRIAVAQDRIATILTVKESWWKALVNVGSNSIRKHL